MSIAVPCGTLLPAATVVNADCRDAMRDMSENSVDAIITDPPYGLKFMGKGWDHGVPGVEFWTEALRVLKPGGHLLAFGGTRTFHRLACAIEDAGFEIRDTLMWVYGSGFPKSLDVSKAIDKARIEDIEPIRVVCRAVRAAMDGKGLKSRDLTQHFGACHPRLIDHWAARDTDSQPALPTWGQWESLRDLLDLSGALDAEVWRLNGRKGQPGDSWQSAEVVGVHDDNAPGNNMRRGLGAAERDPLGEIKAPATNAARQWKGWGTALKPAWEPIIMARKPLEGTVAANVQQYGTGALNIDGCRVDAETGGRPLREVHSLRDGVDYTGNALCGRKDQSLQSSKAVGTTDQGRWPANLIHDGSDEVLAAFPDAKGQQGDLKGHSKDRKSKTCYGDMRPARDHAARIESETSAARFFYCAKASKKDRGDGNKHPTVKPTDLMRYLCRMVTPPGGLILDPFTGSGTTGKAAVLEGFRFVGIEKEAEYAEIARARCDHALCQAQETVPEEKQQELPI